MSNPFIHLAALQEKLQNGGINIHPDLRKKIQDLASLGDEILKNFGGASFNQMTPFSSNSPFTAPFGPHYGNIFRQRKAAPSVNPTDGLSAFMDRSLKGETVKAPANIDGDVGKAIFLCIFEAISETPVESFNENLPQDVFAKEYIELMRSYVEYTAPEAADRIWREIVRRCFTEEATKQEAYITLEKERLANSETGPYLPVEVIKALEALAKFEPVAPSGSPLSRTTWRWIRTDLVLRIFFFMPEDVFAGEQGAIDASLMAKYKVYLEKSATI